MRKRRFLAIGFLDTKARRMGAQGASRDGISPMSKPVALERMGWWDEGA
jgi:hypothetical protein